LICGEDVTKGEVRSRETSQNQKARSQGNATKPEKMQKTRAVNNSRQRGLAYGRDSSDPSQTRDCRSRNLNKSRKCIAVLHLEITGPSRDGAGVQKNSPRKGGQSGNKKIQSTWKGCWRCDFRVAALSLWKKKQRGGKKKTKLHQLGEKEVRKELMHGVRPLSVAKKCNRRNHQSFSF